MRKRHRRINRGKINFDHLIVNRVCVRLVYHGLAIGMCCDVFQRFVIHRENPVFRARFNRHIADGQSVGNAEFPDALSAKFHRAVQRAVHADFSDNM